RTVTDGSLCQAGPVGLCRPAVPVLLADRAVPVCGVVLTWLAGVAGGCGRPGGCRVVPWRQPAGRGLLGCRRWARSVGVRRGRGLRSWAAEVRLTRPRGGGGWFGALTPPVPAGGARAARLALRWVGLTPPGYAC